MLQRWAQWKFLFSTLQRVMCRSFRRTGRRVRPASLGVGAGSLSEGEELSCGGIVWKPTRMDAIMNE